MACLRSTGAARVAAWLAACLAALWLAACGPSSGDGRAEGGGPGGVGTGPLAPLSPPETVRIAEDGAPSGAGFYIADARGYFRELGIRAGCSGLVVLVFLAVRANLAMNELERRLVPRRQG